MKRLLAVLLLALAPTAAAEGPKVGLVLSGGGARGAAHVGVLRALEEMHVPVDVVTGTSMGAIVGGLYAAGHSPDEIDRILTLLDWQEVLSDRTAYRDLVFRRKEDERAYLMNVDVGLSKKGFELPRGLLVGQKLEILLRRSLRPVADVTDFSRLPTPFRAVATDIVSGEPVVLARGDLATAIRASMAIPGVFSPIDIDGRLLVDGGLANNLPVDVARALGAEVIIAVDVSAPLRSRDEIRTLVDVSGQVVDLLTRKNMEPQLADADLVIVPDVQEWSTSAFGEARAIIDAGAAAAREAREALAAWSVDDAAWSAHVAARRQRPPAAPTHVDRIDIAGNRHVDERVIRARLRTTPGSDLDWRVLGDDLSRVFGLGDFEQTRYRLVEGEDGETTLVLEVREKPWGPTYLHFGLEVESDLAGETGFALLANLTRTRLGARGGEWRTGVRIGENQSATSELYQPLDFDGRFFVAPRLRISTQLQSIFDGERKTAEYQIDTFEAAFDLGLRLGRDGELRLGLLRGRDEAEVETGAVELPSFDVDRGGVRLRLEIDGTDDPALPRTGFLLGAELFLSRAGLGADLPYEKLSLRATQFLRRGRSTVFLGLEGGTGLGSDVPFFDQFRVGGLLSLGGFAEGQLRGPIYGVARLGYTFQLAGEIAGLSSGLFAGGVLESGNVWQESEAVGFDDLETTLTLFLATKTFVGPLFVGYGRADRGEGRFYLRLGRTF